ncbi:pan domain-containing protein [Colletotrichum tofieldiae]|nr:pan domain-containing protein [Colletotrichum tofieldiae]
MVSCCPTDSHEGKGSVGGTVLTHSCNKFATVYDKIPKNAATPHDCAKICSKDAIRMHMATQCEMQVKGLKSTHQDELRQIEDRYKAEKSVLEQDMAQCEVKKSQQS